ncbi:GNAT family N-acetyltransferase [Ottowia sp.]|uniref:GNAT family N-acetyltransferase n=1 Tax=Ottowia sp. TaxID=1898956 RepID=UPI001DEF5843|nr:GNAT family N-acetyltransferase [Ottowia sp.]MCB2037363.1 GNAT family N-acetyltransferase [Ottowia sp.]
MPTTELLTPRLRLRPWRASDLEPFAALNTDPEVMRHFPAPLGRADSDAMAGRLQALIEQRGWGFWALERLDTGAFVGYAGLGQAPQALPFAPAVEIGWRLARAHWGLGLASEAARRSAEHAFGPLGLTELVAFTALGNQRSRAVMQRLCMREAGQFDHPALPHGHLLRRHWLYRLERADLASRILGA